MAQARRGDDPYQRALTDPDFLRAVTAAHRGRWPVLDALWWWSHPSEAAPSGSLSPAARLSTLQRRLFGADGDAAGDGAVAAAARELEVEIAAERAALGAALAAAGAGEEVAGGGARTPAVDSPRPATAPPTAPAAELAPPISAEAAEPPDLSEGGPIPDPAAQRNRLLLGAGLVGALLLGALLGSQVTAANPPGALAPTPAASSTGSNPSAVPVIAAQVFARVQTGQDIPRVPLPGAYDPASFRYLGAAGWRDSDANGVTDSPYYAARGAENLVCLVVVPEGAGYLTTCTPEEDFPSTGLRLSWQSTDFLPMEQDGRAMVMDITVAWLSDSTIETRGSGRSLIP